MQIKSHHCKCCYYKLPYIIPNEYADKTIGVFGDSFAGLGSEEIYTKNHTSSPPGYEHSWMFYLGMLSNSIVHSWGISGGAESDILVTLLKHTLVYDYYIVFHTSPVRALNPKINNYTFKNIHTTKNKAKLSKAFYKETSKFLKDKKVLHLYWNKEHMLYNFIGKNYCMEHILKHHFNPHDKLRDLQQDLKYNFSINDNCDIYTGKNHLTNRGNLILSIQVNKLLFSNDASS